MGEVVSINELAGRLRPHYSRFLEPLGDRVLLTGHSHQAWPNVSRDGQMAAWDDAARLLDHKWDRVFGELIPELQSRIAARLGTTRAADIAFAPNTHELVYRLSSCFPAKSAIVSTDSEFHSLRRQLDRFEEEGAKIERVPVELEGDASTFSARFIEAVDRVQPSWVALSYVLFTTSRVVRELPRILEAMRERKVPVLVDAYHAFNVLELEVDKFEGDVFVCGGGYKYAECGEGVCFMLLPKIADKYRPLTTGWFSHFESLEKKSSGGVAYGGGGYRFFGATFDPTSFYRALWVMRFMDEQGLTVPVLAEQSAAQTQRIIDAAAGLEKFGIRVATPKLDRGGFVSLETPRAKALEGALYTNGVHTDVRGHLLRLGPAPYLSTLEIDRAMDVLASCARS
jgi:selenocysteine lyase/cysteine desulfurase